MPRQRKWHAKTTLPSWRSRKLEKTWRQREDEATRRLGVLFNLDGTFSGLYDLEGDGRTFLNYRLPDGRIVPIDASVARDLPTIDFMLADGEIVVATRVDPESS